MRCLKHYSSTVCSNVFYVCGIFNDYFVANFVPSLAVKEFREVIEMSRGSCVFWLSVYMLKSWLKTRKRKYFYTNLHLKDGLGIECTYC